MAEAGFLWVQDEAGAFLQTLFEGERQLYFEDVGDVVTASVGEGDQVGAVVGIGDEVEVLVGGEVVVGPG